MKATYTSKLTSNETVVVKQDRFVPIMDGDRMVDHEFKAGLKAQFNDYVLVTEDEEVIRYMDNPKNGFGTLWNKLLVVEPKKEK